jgi:signal transduction histidine kinase
VSQRIIKQHGGDIRAESEPGHGTVFFVRVPLIDPHDSRPAVGDGTAAA